MISYIGDISKADAEVLKELAQESMNILEFGCGASTQVIAAYSDRSFVSIDTEQVWIDKTKENLKVLGLEDKEVHFNLYPAFEQWLMALKPGTWEYDFVFDDGADGLRLPFARLVWPQIHKGGCLAFHDTRRPHDFGNVLELLRTYQDEIDMVLFNYRQSNITLVYKKKPEPYDNWQITEKKEKWQLGWEPIPEEIIPTLRIKEA